MSTFYGGEQLVNTVSFNAGTLNSINYTVPTGRYAILRVLSNSGSMNITIDFNGNGFLANGQLPNTSVEGFPKPEYYLDEGDEITKPGGNDSTFFIGIVFEYQKP